MYQYMVDHPEFLTHDNNEGLERALNENYAYLMESSSIQYIIERNCEVTQIGDLLDDKNYGIGMRKGILFQMDFTYFVKKNLYQSNDYISIIL